VDRAENRLDHDGDGAWLCLVLYRPAWEGADLPAIDLFQV